MPADHAADALALPDDALLAPGIRHVVATLRAGMRAGSDITTMPLGEARARYAAQQQLWQPRVPPGVTIRRFLIATGAGPLPAVAVHAQGGQLSAARVLYRHGGGWVLGSVDTHLAAMAVRNDTLVPEIYFEIRDLRIQFVRRKSKFVSPCRATTFRPQAHRFAR